MHRLVVGFVVLGSFATGDAAARSIRYADLFDGRGDGFDLERREMDDGVHLVHPIEVCGPQGDYDCLSTEFDFALSAPRRGVPNGTEWKIGRYRFKTIGGGPMRLGGRDLSATIIDTTVEGQDRASIRAVYDAKYGIVAYAHLRWENHAQTNVPMLHPIVTHPAVAIDKGLWAR